MKPKVSDLLSKYAPETDKEAYHGYGTTLYDTLFLPYRDRELNILEIGVWWGGSLRAWSEYFTCDWTIITGVDIEDRWRQEQWKFIDDARIQFGNYNAYDKRKIDEAIYYDIIIDDGPHGLVNQKAALELYYPQLENGGILVIEDINDLNDCHELAKIQEPDIQLCGKSQHSNIMVWTKQS
jgi:cephalosporin hydroxylase